MADAEILEKSPIDPFQAQWDERVTVSEEQQAKDQGGYGHHYEE